MSNEQMRPASKEQAPDPAHTYERAKPERESQGKLGKLHTPPAKTPDKMEQSVPQHQNPARQINADEQQSGKAAQENTPQASQPAKRQPDHSMNDEPQTGWDTAPNDIANPRNKRHPRTGGKGGTPDAGQNPANS
jgi:hypothetical protein